MNNATDVIVSLRAAGKKITPVRKTIIELIIATPKPMSALALSAKLKDRGFVVNKTTVYRALDALVEASVVKKVNLESGIVHYESAYLPHHHHLSCTSCGEVQEVQCEQIESEMEKLTSTLRSQFEIKSHNLEFYGFCADCTSQEL